MATTTATIFVGQSHQNHSGIIPSHLIILTENSRPALSVRSLNKDNDTKVIIPTTDNTVDDIYLVIAVFILNKIPIQNEFKNIGRKSLYDLFSKEEREILYNKSKNIIKDVNIKVVFNILEGSVLLNQIDLLKKYPNDYEVTTPLLKCEYNSWSGKIEIKEFK